jgi:tetratricopeptide (TPR) repeat protein
MGLARLYNNVANIYHRTDDHATAYGYYEKAYGIFQKLGDEDAIAVSTFNLSTSLADVDQFEKSDEMYAKAIELSERRGLTDLATQANYNRAYLQYLRGRYSEALDSFSRLRLKFEAAGSWRHLALCDLDEAEIYLQLNLSKDAAILAMRAADECQRIGMRYEQAKATAFYGVALMQQRRFTAALQAFGGRNASSKRKTTGIGSGCSICTGPKFISPWAGIEKPKCSRHRQKQASIGSRSPRSGFSAWFSLAESPWRRTTWRPPSSTQWKSLRL